MHLLVVRHAIAEDRAVFARTGRSDDLRPLTDDGRAKMRRAADGLRSVAPEVDLIAASPLVRAKETAEIVAGALDVDELVTIEALRPEAPYEELVNWAASKDGGADADVIAIVGHEPHLSGLITWLMTGSDDSRLDLKKGAAVLLSFDDGVRRGEGTLQWALAPGHLRRLGD
jgi:phosphohistidine phosphatase